MEKEEMEKLGFTEELSWESEEAEKKYLFNKIENQKRRAYERAKLQADTNYKSQFTPTQSEEKTSND